MHVALTTNADTARDRACNFSHLACQVSECYPFTPGALYGSFVFHCCVLFFFCACSRPPRCVSTGPVVVRLVLVLCRDGK